MEAVKDYTSGQINSAIKLINILMGVPEERRPIITAIATAYIDGVEAGTRIVDKAETNGQIMYTYGNSQSALEQSQERVQPLIERR